MEEQVRRSYPGPLEEIVIVRLRRLGAALLVPRTNRTGEGDLPIPALLLNRRGPKRSGIYHASTSRGFDLYQLRAGRLTAAWSAATVPAESREIPRPKATRGLLGEDILRAGRSGHHRIRVLTVVLLLLALVLRIIADQLPPNPGMVPESPGGTGAQDRHSPVEIPFSRALEDLAKLKGLIPEFFLETLELAPGSATFRFTTSDPPESILAALIEAGIPGPLGSYRVDREKPGTVVTMEEHYGR